MLLFSTIFQLDFKTDGVVFFVFYSIIAQTSNNVYKTTVNQKCKFENKTKIDLWLLVQ